MALSMLDPHDKPSLQIQALQDFVRDAQEEGECEEHFFHECLHWLHKSVAAWEDEHGVT